jgi:serine/threonine protein phosphatase PrpC
LAAAWGGDSAAIAEVRVKVECFGQSRPQEGRQQTQNQDAYVVGRQPVPWIALSDGAGNAQSAARRALSLFEMRLLEAPLAQLLRDETWICWVRSLDSALLGGSEATFVAAAVVGDQVIGAVAGDSRAYLTPLEGPVRLLTGSASKARLGSSETAPVVFRDKLAARDVLLLVSDGAWTPLVTSGLERVVRGMVTKAFADLPSVVLDEASRRGRGDDMTAVALRLLGG